MYKVSILCKKQQKSMHSPFEQIMHACDTLYNNHKRKYHKVIFPQQEMPVVRKQY